MKIKKKNRKSFVHVTQTDEKDNSISVRVIRIIRNRPVLIGVTEISRKLSDFKAMKNSSKRGYIRLAVYVYLINRGQISTKHVEGVDYFLEGI